jgi:hypothetical protein
MLEVIPKPLSQASAAGSPFLFSWLFQVALVLPDRWQLWQLGLLVLFDYLCLCEILGVGVDVGGLGGVIIVRLQILGIGVIGREAGSRLTTSWGGDAKAEVGLSKEGTA